MENGIVEFYGQKLITSKNEKDVEYVAMKPLCENIGIDWDSQRKRIIRDEVLNSTTVIMTVVAQDGKNREMLMLPVDYLNGWLFGIDVSRLKNEVTKERIIVYKKECYKVLHRYWTGGANDNYNNLNNRVERLENMFCDMNHYFRDMNNSLKDISKKMDLEKIAKNTRPETQNIIINSEETKTLEDAQTHFQAYKPNKNDNLKDKEKFYQDILRVIKNHPDGASQRTLLAEAGYNQSKKIRRWLQEQISILWDMTIIPGKCYKYIFKDNK